VEEFQLIQDNGNRGMPWVSEVSKTYIRTFKDLEPNTKYAVKVKLGYRGSRDPQFFWPTDNLKFVFKTKGIRICMFFLRFFFLPFF
jgi:hypothetical protein